MNKRKIIFRIFIYTAAVLICLFSLFPILWGLSTSFKPEALIYSQLPQWIPKQITFKHYNSILSDARMIRYFFNSFVIAGASAIIALITGVLGAYGFSRYKFPGNKTLLISILLTRLLPGASLIVPFFITLRKLKMYNTRAGLILVFLIVTMPISIWLLKAFFDDIPYEIEEAATIDGCSALGILTRIVIPISLPAIAAVGTCIFIAVWNEFLLILVLTKGIELRTISVGLGFFIDEYGVKWGPLMAGSILMSIPSIIVFIMFQKSLVKGLSEGAIKG